MTQQNDMFPDMPATPSPRLQWLEKHGLMLVPCDGEEVGDPDGWACGYKEDFEDENLARAFKDMGFGPTEREAEVNFCEKNNVKHYTLE